MDWLPPQLTNTANIIAIALLGIASSLVSVFFTVLITSIYKKSRGSFNGTKRRSIANLALLGNVGAISAGVLLSVAVQALFSNSIQAAKTFTVIGGTLLIIVKFSIPVGAFLGKALAAGGTGEVGRRIVARFMNRRHILEEPPSSPIPVTAHSEPDEIVSPASIVEETIEP